MYRNMKDMKKIDNNKMTPKKIAACTLAATMAVTAVPANIPLVGNEIVKAANVTIDEPISFSLVNKITAGTTFGSTADYLSLNYSTSSYGSGVWAQKPTSVTIKDAANGNLIWSTAAEGTKQSTDKYEAGGTYYIYATFENKDASITLTSGAAASDAGFSMAQPSKVVSYGTDSDCIKFEVTHLNGGLDDVQTSGEYLYRNASGAKDAAINNTIVKNSSGWFYVNDGTTMLSSLSGKKGVARNSNGMWYLDGGKVDFTYTGFVTQDAALKITTGIDGTYYVEKGAVTGKANGIIKDENAASETYYNVVNSKVTAPEKATAVKIANRKWMYINTSGASDFNKDGFVTNSNGTWCVEVGMVDFDANGFITDLNSEISGTGTDVYYVVDGKVQLTTTGYVFDKNDNLKYVKNGKVTSASLTAPTVVKKADGVWFAVDTDGNPSASYDGKLLKNDNGVWYIGTGSKSGKVDFSYTGLVTDAQQAMGGTTTDVYLVKNGKVDTTKTGLVDNGSGSLQYVKNGKATGAPTDETIIKADDGKWYNVKTADGTIDTVAGNFGINKYGIWVTEGGKVTFKKTGLVLCASAIGDIPGGSTVYVKDSKVMTSYTGVVVDGTNVEYVKDGVKSTKVPEVNPTVVKATDGNWYYITEVGLTTGPAMATNQYGTWYVDSNGKVDFKKTGVVQVSSKKYYVENGKLNTNKNGIVFDGYRKAYYVENGVVTPKDVDNSVVKASDGKWYYVKPDGEVDYTYNMYAANANGVWKIKGGVVDFNYSALEVCGNTTGFGSTSTIKLLKDVGASDLVYVKGGKVQFDFSGLVSSGGTQNYVKKGVAVANAQLSRTDVVKSTDGKWYYIKADGTVDTTFTGVKSNINGSWYIYKGVVNFDKTGVVNNDNGSGKNVYVEKGKLQENKTGIVSSGNDKFYVVNGVATGKTALKDNVVKVDGTWYCIDTLGKVAQPAGKIGGNKYGFWMIDDKGKVDFKYTKPFQVTDGTTATALGGTANDYVYIAGGKFQKDSTCVYVDKDTSDKYYFVNGVSAIGKTCSTGLKTAVKANDGKWYGIEESAGKYVFMSSAGIVENKNGKWYVDSNGVVDFTKTGIFNSKYVEKGKITGKYTGFVTDGTTKYYVVDSAVKTLAAQDIIKESTGKWNLVDTNGTVLTSFTGVETNDNGSWYIKKGVVDFTYTGFYSTQATDSIYNTESRKTYIKGGKFQGDVTDIVTIDGQKWNIVEGILTAPASSTVIKGSDGAWYYVEGTYGKVDTSFTGIGTNDYGDWYVKAGKVDTSFTGTYKNAVTGKSYKVVAGRVVSEV